MKLTDFIAAMEHIAPPGLAMDFDNVGLLLGTDRHEITRVLVALDCTPATAQEAVDWNADLLLTHHPLFLDGQNVFCPVILQRLAHTSCCATASRSMPPTQTLMLRLAA